MRILVIGCGYLGLRAAELWVKSGHEVHAITRSPERAEAFKQANITPCVADITNQQTLQNLPSVDVVFFAVGFDRSVYTDIREVYVTGLQNVLQHLESVQEISQFIYISSTGVYGNCNGNWVDEDSVTDPQRPGGKACLEAERLIRSSNISERATLLRLAGIYGPNRVPRLDVLKKQQWSSLGQSGHVNLVHVEDAANIALEIVKRKIVNQLLLVADGHPPLRKDFYQFVADQLDAGPIDWSVTTAPDVSRRAAADKRISNRKLVQLLDYQFTFPSYETGIQNAIQQSNLGI